MLDLKSIQEIIQKLNYSEKKLNKILQKSPLAYFCWDENGEIINLNHYALELLEIEKDEIIDKNSFPL